MYKNRMIPNNKCEVIFIKTKEVMTHKVYTLKRENSVEDAINLMATEDVGSIQESGGAQAVVRASTG